MDIRQIVRTVRANWIVALITFLACLAIGGAYAVLPAKQYSASVVLLAQPPAGASDPGADVGAIQIEIPQIAVEAQNATIDSQARQQVPANLRGAPVSVSAAGDPASNTVTISASSTDPRAAQAYANATAARVLKVTNRDAGSLLVLSELGAARAPDQADEPPRHGGSRVSGLRVHRRRLRCPGGGGLTTFRRGRRDLGTTRHSGPGRGPDPVPGRGEPGRDVQDGGNERGVEAFQQLRSHLYVLFQDTHPVIAFTSCQQREGKSTVVSHAAWALATSGQFVVAVDADLRQPTLHEIFDVDLSPGVSDIALASGPSELLAATGNRYLELIPAGVPNRHPADIAAAEMPRLLRALRGRTGRSSWTAPRSRVQPRPRSSWPKRMPSCSWSTPGSSPSRAWNTAWPKSPLRAPTWWASS